MVVGDGARAVARHTLQQMRRSSIGWSIGLVLVAAGGIAAYTTAYPTDASRRAAAALLGSNGALTVFYGPARNIATVGGFAAWRYGLGLATMAGIWGLLA